MSKLYIVTGGAGFIGTNLCLNIISRLQPGDFLQIIDNMYCENFNNKAILQDESLKCPGQVNFSQMDINSPHLKEDLGLFVGKNYTLCDVEIYHLACPASPDWYKKDPLYTLNTCINGTQNVLSLADDYKRYGASVKVLFTSTSEIYGDPLVHPQVETYTGNVNTMGPRSCYDEGKRAAETMCYIYQQQGLDVRVVRLFNTFGPHMNPNDGRVISNFIMAHLSGKPMTIYGDGSRTRSICYIDDTVNALRLVMESPVNLGVMNIGNVHELPIKEIAKLVATAASGSTEVPQINFIQETADDPKIRCPDISKIKSLLGWEPRVDLLTGVACTYRYFRGLQQ